MAIRSTLEFERDVSTECLHPAHLLLRPVAHRQTPIALSPRAGTNAIIDQSKGLFHNPLRRNAPALQEVALSGKPAPA